MANDNPGAFDNLLAAVQQGGAPAIQAAMQAKAQGENRAAAFNALAHIYGPRLATAVSTNPEGAKAAQEIALQQQQTQGAQIANQNALATQPYVVPMAQANLASTQADIGRTQAQTSELGAQTGLTQAQTAQVAPNAAAQNAEHYASARAANSEAAKNAVAAQTAQMEQQAIREAQRLSTLQGILSRAKAVGTAAQAVPGAPPNAAQSASAHYLASVGPQMQSLLGYDPAHIGAAVQAVGTNPDALDNISAEVGARLNAIQQSGAAGGGAPHVSSIQTDAEGNEYAVLSNNTVQPLGIRSGSFAQKTPGYVGNVAAAKTVGAATGAAQAQGIHGVEDIAKAQQQQGSRDVAFDAAQKNLDQALQYSQQAGAMAKNQARLTNILGTPTAGANLESVLNSVHSDVVNNVISAYKNSTQKGQASGVGRVMASEIKLWTDAYAAVQLDQSPDLRNANIKRLMTVTDRLKAQSDKYFKTVYGLQPTGAAGNTQTSAQGGWSNFRVH